MRGAALESWLLHRLPRATRYIPVCRRETSSAKLIAHRCSRAHSYRHWSETSKLGIRRSFKSNVKESCNIWHSRWTDLETAAMSLPRNDCGRTRVKRPTRSHPSHATLVISVTLLTTKFKHFRESTLTSHLAFLVHIPD